ncbi:MAG: hypothetical protein LBV33_02875, partial [Lachnospiraceae bacterium]|nr:hypothetical protein [Lachnospiraceae bacterium]
MMRLIYLLYPIEGPTAVKQKVINQYYENICATSNIPVLPHHYDKHIDNGTYLSDDIHSIKINLALLQKCDEVWIMGSDVKPEMRMVIDQAKANGIPVFIVKKPLDISSYPVSTDHNGLLGQHSCIEGSNEQNYENQILV